MNILIADDHSLYREFILSLLEVRFPDTQAFEATNYEDIRSLCDKILFDLIILDITMPKMEGLKSAIEVIKNYPRSKVLVCSASDNPVLIQTIRSIGAKGFISKSMSANKFISGISKILDGEYYFPRSIINGEFEKLTPKQLEVLGLICSGLSNKEIAAFLNLSIHTIKFHVRLILDRLEVATRQQLLSLYNLPKSRGLEKV